MRDAALLVRLDGHADRSQIGGKAAALDRLIELGEPVPRAAALTRAAGRPVVRAPAVADVLRRLDDGDPLVTDDDIDAAFLDAELPDDVRDAIAEVAARLTGRLAVRSSATAEDLDAAAFAGQYRTVLDVGGVHELEHAVRLVWASLWHDAPRRYRAARGVADGRLEMAVLVMEMVDARTAGVLFTRDPVGDAADLRLETVAGSGERLVSGAVTPTAHVWPRAEAAQLAARALGPVAAELVERSLALEDTLGAPQDVEFATDPDGQLWLLQARPITTLRSSTDLTRAGIAEMLPGVLPPLLQATAGRQVDEGFRNLLTDLGGTVEGPLIRFVRSAAMLDLANLRRATATVPGGSVADLERGAARGTPRPGPEARSSPSIARTARILRRRRTAALEAEIVDAAVDRLVAFDDPVDVMADDDLLATWERVLDLGMRAATAEMEVAALATAAYHGAERALARHLPDGEATALAQRATRRRRSGGPLVRCTRSLPALPDRPGCAPTWRELAWEDAAAWLDRSEVGRRFAAAWADCLARSGSRSVFGGPTWADEPELAWLAFAARGQDTGRSEPAARTSLRAELADLRGLTPLRRRFLRRELADAASLLDRRERSKQSLLDVGGIAHRLTAEIGGRLARRGSIEHAVDVWLLSPAEVRHALLRGRAPRDLGERRVVLDEDVRSAAAGATTGPGRGWGASPGTATGPARLVERPRAGALAPGEVLVARNTDAGWSPLFAIAGAIVVEQGGPLSHAAIVARELGVPAVVNLPGIVERVRRAGAGATLTVDGTTGAVELHRADDGDHPSPVSTVPVLSPPDETARVAVFVTGLIGASALFGTVVSITQAVSSRRGARRLHDRARAPATILARVVRGGSAVTRGAVEGLRSARWYAWSTLFVIGLGLAVAGTGVGEYATSEPGASVLGLAAILTGTGAAATLTVGGVLAWRRWPDVPPTIRRLTPPRSEARAVISLHHVWHALPELHRRWLVVTGSTSLALLAWTVTNEASLRRIDEWLYDRIGAPHADPIGPEWFGMYFGRPQVVIPAALLVALFTVRCRVLALAYPATIAFGGLVNLGLGMLVGRERPPRGAHWYQTDSFPSGHAIEVTLLLGLLPLGVAVLLRSHRAGLVARMLSTAVLVVMLVDGLRSGSHWPSDHLAGFSIGLFAVILVHALARAPALHRSCVRCPALAVDRSVDLHGDAR